MKREIRNPKSHRHTEANAERTAKVVEAYYGKIDIERTWELMPINVQAKNHGEIIGLRKRIRNLKNLLLHRADAKIRI